MASICSADITIKNSEYRPCIVKGKKALFHRWNVIPLGIPIPMTKRQEKKYAAAKRIVDCTVAIIEYEDGKIRNCNPTDIQFVDNPFAEIVFPPEVKTDEN